MRRAILDVDRVKFVDSTYRRPATSLVYWLYREVDAEGHSTLAHVCIRTLRDGRMCEKRKMKKKRKGIKRVEARFAMLGMPLMTGRFNFGVVHRGFTPYIISLREKSMCVFWRKKKKEKKEEKLTVYCMTDDGRRMRMHMRATRISMRVYVCVCVQ